MNSGFTKFHRKILEWEWYTDIPVKTLFFHLIIRANFEDAKWRGIDIKRGEVLTSNDSLSKETGLSVQQVRTAIKKLKSTSEITSKATSKNTIITICNYDSYNPKKDKSNKQPNKQPNKRATNEQQTSNKQITTDKKKENELEEREEKKDSKTENPSLSLNIDTIVSFWKEKRGDNVIVDSAITRMLSRSISEYGVDTIKGSIDKYDKALRGEEFWWSHTYSLFDFIQNGLVKFIHVSDDLSSMRKGEKKITPQDNCKESMSFDEMYQEVLKEKSMSNG